MRGCVVVDVNEQQASAQDEREAIHLAFEHKLREVNLPAYGEHRGDWRSLTREETADVVIGLLRTRPAQTEQQPIQVTAVAILKSDGDGGLEPDWLLEGGTAELFEGMVLVVAADGEITGEDGCGEVYTSPVAPAGRQVPAGYLTTDDRFSRLAPGIPPRHGDTQLYAAPVAQTEQPEQSGLLAALEKIARITGDGINYHPSHMSRIAREALSAYRAALSTQGGE